MTQTHNGGTGVGLTDDFGQFLPSQWNAGKFGADSAEPSAQDPLCFFTVGRVASVRDNRSRFSM